MPDTPPKIVTFRLEPRTVEDVHYDLSLELVGHVHQVIEKAVTRFHLKNRLDHRTTTLPMTFAAIRDELRTQRWRNYRIALELLSEIGTVLDIMARQRCTTATGDLFAAQLIVQRLRADIRTLCNPAW